MSTQLKLCAAVVALGTAAASVPAGAQSASPSASLTTASDSDAGMLAFNNHCRECHSYKDGDNRLGPFLYGVVGRKAGTAKGFGNYSDSLKNSGITWTPELLDQWITNPQTVVPNNNMAPPYPGLDDASQRAAIISFLKTDTSSAATGAGTGSGTK